MIKSRCGIVAALAFLFCCSQSEAGDGKNAKLMADRPEAQGPEWVLYEDLPEGGFAGRPEAKRLEYVLYEDLPEDSEIVSFNQVGDSEGAFEVCQSEDGAVGTTEDTQGGLVCRTAEGAQKSFYVLQLVEGADDGEAGGLAAKMQKKLGTEQPELPPFLLFDWTEEEWREINIAIGETGAAKRMTEEMQEKLGTEQPELPPFLLFDWTEEEWRKINIAIGETDAAKRMSEECAVADAPEACGFTKYRNGWCLCAAVEGVGRATESFGHYRWGIASIKKEFFCLFNN